MVFGRRSTVLEEKPNPLALPPKTQVQEEDIGLDDIFGAGVSHHFEEPQFGSAGISLYPVAGGVGLSTLVRYSHGKLHQDGKDTLSDAVVLVSTTAADHLLKTQNLLRTGQTAHGQQIVGIVLVADRPKLSKATIQEAKKTTRMTKHSWGVPYVGALREPTDPGRMPLRFRKVIHSLVKETSPAHQSR